MHTAEWAPATSPLHLFTIFLAESSVQLCSILEVAAKHSTCCLLQHVSHPSNHRWLKAANSRHIWWISLRLVAWFIGRPLMELKNPAVFNKWIMRWKLIAIKKWTLMHEQSQWRSHWHCNMQICVQLWLTIIRALHVNLESYSDFATHTASQKDAARS